MTIEQAVDYIYASYVKAEPFLAYDAPDSEKRNPALSKAMIEKRAKKPTAVVTGSKGKGSVAKMLAEVLGAYVKTGLMTSPHIVRFNERIQVQGEPVRDEALIAAIERLKPEADAVERTLSENEYLSPMGIQTVAALDIFAQEEVAFQVMECGKGAAYDDVNNVPHEYAVINHIFLEHTRELGATLSEIAENKAAVMNGMQKAVFTGKQEPEVMAVLRKRAEACRVPLFLYGRDFWCEHVQYTKSGMQFDVVTRRMRYTDLQIPLLGTYQAENCALAIAAAEEMWMQEYGELMEQGQLRTALRRLEWPGRLEVLSANPLMLLDACINRESCKNVLEALQELSEKEVTAIIGIPSDKDYLGVAMAMAPVCKHIILTQSSNRHYRFGKEQAEVLQKHHISAIRTESIAEAMEQARSLAAEEEAWDTAICILGTTSLISDVKTLAATPMPL